MNRDRYIYICINENYISDFFYHLYTSAPVCCIIDISFSRVPTKIFAESILLLVRVWILDIFVVLPPTSLPLFLGIMFNI